MTARFASAGLKTCVPMLCVREGGGVQSPCTSEEERVITYTSASSAPRGFGPATLLLAIVGAGVPLRVTPGCTSSPVPEGDGLTVVTGRGNMYVQY